jgi:DnaK suppressor protein
MTPRRGSRPVLTTAGEVLYAAGDRATDLEAERGGEMDPTQARALLAGERARLQRLLQAQTGNPQAAELGDEIDDADRRNANQTGTAVNQLLQARWAALERAEARLAAGSYGRSVLSGLPIPDERLEADPLAELTVQEAAATEPSPVEQADDAVGLVSATHPFEVLADAGITPEETQASEEDDDEPAPEPDLGIHIEPHNQAR